MPQGDEAAAAELRKHYENPTAVREILWGRNDVSILPCVVCTKRGTATCPLLEGGASIAKCDDLAPDLSNLEKFEERLLDLLTSDPALLAST